MDRQQKQEKMKASAASDDMVQTELQKEKKWFEFWK